jgi:hypothetical protein
MRTVHCLFKAERPAINPLSATTAEDPTLSNATSLDLEAAAKVTTPDTTFKDTFILFPFKKYLI